MQVDRVGSAISSVPPLSTVPPQVQKLFRDHVTETFNDFTPVVDVAVAKQEARDCSGTRGAHTRAGTHRSCSLRTSLARTGIAEAMRASHTRTRRKSVLAWHLHSIAHTAVHAETHGADGETHGV